MGQFAVVSDLALDSVRFGFGVAKAAAPGHSDADPANYTPVGENVLPPFYTTPDDVFLNKPTDPCNWARAEDYSGRRKGLDNDGDGKYDRADRDCRPTTR